MSLYIWETKERDGHPDGDWTTVGVIEPTNPGLTLPLVLRSPEKAEYWRPLAEERAQRLGVQLRLAHYELADTTP